MESTISNDYFQTQFRKRHFNILSTQQYADCTFLVGLDDSNQQAFKAHKLIMAIASPVFGAMFFGEIGKMKTEEPIRIIDVDPDAFKLLLNYIYSGTPNTFSSVERAGNVCCAANKYLLFDLAEHNAQLIIQKLSVSNACEAYMIGKLLGMSVLIEESWEVIRSKTEKVLDDPSFVNVDFSLLLAILDCKCLNISAEVLLFNATHKWAIEECRRKGLSEDRENLRAVVSPALEKIHFLSMTPQDFGTGPAKTSLLTESEILSIFLNLFNTDVPKMSAMPSLFSLIPISCEGEECDEDELMINFFDSKNRSIAYFSSATYEESDSSSLIEVGFDKPVRIQRNEKYKITVQLFHTNEYPSFTTCNSQSVSELACEGTNFTFFPSKRDFLEGFIFSTVELDKDQDQRPE